MDKFDVFMLATFAVELAVYWLLYRIARQLGATPQLVAWLRSLKPRARR